MKESGVREEALVETSQSESAPFPGSRFSGQAFVPFLADWFRSPANLLLVAFALIFAVLRFANGLITDDAFITFAYAKNLVEGHGFVFNPGEYVYGTTTPVFGLLVAFGMAFGLKPWTWVFLLDCLFTFFILIRLRELLQAVGLQHWFVLVALFEAVPYIFTAAIPGMETQLYTFTILSALAACAKNNRPIVTIAWGTAAALVRPDGLVTLLTVMIFALVPLLIKKQWKTILIAILPAGLLAIHCLLTFWYFGSAIPLSVKAKSLLFAETGTDRLLSYTFLRDHIWVFGRLHFLGMIAIAGAFYCARKRPLRPVFVLYIAYIAAFHFGRAPIDYFWYRTPLFVLMYFFSAVALAAVVERLGVFLPSRLQKKYFLVPAGVVLGCLLAIPQWHIHFIIQGRQLSDFAIITDGKAYQRVANYIAEQEPHADIAAYEVGALGYFSEVRVSDMVGILAPEVYKAKLDNSQIDPLELTRANWFVHPYYDSLFEQQEPQMAKRLERYGFHAVQEYHWPWDGPGTTVVYRRKNSE